MMFLASFKYRADAAWNEEVMSLTDVLESTLESLEPLPRTKAAARRIDPLNRLESELFTVQPFIDLYRKAYSRWAVNPPQLPGFVSQTQLFKIRVEAERQTVRIGCCTDIHATREIVLRQLAQIFDKTLTNETAGRQTVEMTARSAAQNIKFTRRPCGWRTSSKSVAFMNDPTLPESQVCKSSDLSQPIAYNVSGILEGAPIRIQERTCDVAEEMVLIMPTTVEKLSRSLSEHLEGPEPQGLTIRWL